MIAHFLGVDHAGHRYGPNHPEMESKLGQMSDILQHIFDTMDNDTIVFVLGDHGMDEKGDHGGDSELETTTTMFVHSKNPLTSIKSMDFLTKHNILEHKSTPNFRNWRYINQIGKNISQEIN
jgi:phosphatidylinositol glycan class O